MSITIAAELENAPITLDSGYPIVVPRVVTFELEADHQPLRLFGDLLCCNKALFCFETRELHTPAVVTGNARATFISSVVSALTCAAEALGLVDPREGGPTYGYVRSIAERVNECICTPPLDRASFECTCDRAFDHAAEDRARYYSIAEFEVAANAPGVTPWDTCDEKREG